jgi:purine-nucleoside phosphorylase
MNHLENELQQAVDAWRRRGWPSPEAMVVAGSGLAMDLGPSLVGRQSWAELLPFPIAGIAGHTLDLDLVEVRPGRVVLSSRGRIHAYQGHSAAEAVFTVRLAALLGVKVLLLTNSSGGLQLHHRPGDMVVLNDHLNLTGMNPLWGRFPSAWGAQFPDMLHAYDPALRRRLLAAAAAQGVAVSEGVYAGLPGPSYETAAEVRMLRILGADVVGMSTVLEVIAAHHMGVRCACVSVVSNPGAGVTDEKLVHEDVLARGKEASRHLALLLKTVLSDSDLLAPDNAHR